MIFWRVFMRISYSCPSHLKFGLTVEQWTKMVVLTGNAIDWLDANENYYDVWLLVAYSATSCALVQVSVFIYLYDSELRLNPRSITLGRDAKTPTLRRSCASSEIQYDGGRLAYRLTTCPLDARSSFHFASFIAAQPTLFCSL